RTRRSTYELRWPRQQRGADGDIHDVGDDEGHDAQVERGARAEEDRQPGKAAQVNHRKRDEHAGESSKSARAPSPLGKRSGNEGGERIRIEVARGRAQEPESAAVTLRENGKSGNPFQQIQRGSGSATPGAEYYTNHYYSERLQGQRHRRERNRNRDLCGDGDDGARADDEQDLGDWLLFVKNCWNRIHHSSPKSPEGA